MDVFSGPVFTNCNFMYTVSGKKKRNGGIASSYLI